MTLNTDLTTCFNVAYVKYINEYPNCQVNTLNIVSSLQFNLSKVSWGLLGPQRTLMAHIFVIGWTHSPVIFIIL